MPSQPQQGCVDGRVILATQLLGGPGPQSGAPAAQQEEDLGLYRCEGWASPSQQSVSPSQAVCQVRQGLWGPSLPTANLALAKGQPDCRGRADVVAAASLYIIAQPWFRRALRTLFTLVLCKACSS